MRAVPCHEGPQTKKRRVPAITYFPRRGLAPSIIGPTLLNFRVRDGNGCGQRGRITRTLRSLPDDAPGSNPVRAALRRVGSANVSFKVAAHNAQQHLRASVVCRMRRLISTARLKPLRALHLPPIDLVFSQEPMKPDLGKGFALRCFQRLSLPNVATVQCPWQDNTYTRGSCFSVLSY